MNLAQLVYYTSSDVSSMKESRSLLLRLTTTDLLTKEKAFKEETTSMRARVIGYIPLDRGSPSKKSRVSHLVDVTRAKSDTDRLKKLALAAKAFSHSDASKHDDDIKAGAASILCSLLRSCSPAKSKEVVLLCKILIKLYRCNEDRARASFCIDGAVLISNLLEVIEINYRLGRRGDAMCLVVAQNLIDKLLSVACVPVAFIKRHEDLISSLVSNVNGATGKLVMLISMKCLSVLSEHQQNKQLLLTYPGLIQSVEIGSRHMSETVREESARIICNLAWDVRNKAKLASHSERGWAQMIYTSLTDPTSSVASKLYAMKTLTYLSSEVRNKDIIVNYDNGAAISQLARLVCGESSVDSQVSIAAAELVGSLVCRSTASKVALCKLDFLSTLASLACGKSSVALPSSKVLKKLSTYIHSSDSHHEELLQALVTMSYAIQTEVIKLTVKAYAEQAESPHDRIRMISHKGLLAALNMLAGDENDTVRDLAQFVITALAADVANAKGVGVNEVLSQVNTKNLRRSRLQPRCYSPTSVMLFHFDFDLFEGASSLV